EILLPVGGLIDIEKEKERLGKEITQAETEVQRAEEKLSNESFIKKAPQKLVDAEKEKLDRARQKLEKLIEKLKSLE
ncbi:MAG: hypothetical protein GX891_01750, partial [Clostridiales bacterium]|nr:hypothetical protein [Clostridiales bacterium]